MKRARIKNYTFSVIQWHGEDYPKEYLEQDIENGTFLEGEEVLVLHEVKTNIYGKVYVVFSERIQECSTLSEKYLDFIEEKTVEQFVEQKLEELNKIRKFDLKDEFWKLMFDLSDMYSIKPKTKYEDLKKEIVNLLNKHFYEIYNYYPKK